MAEKILDYEREVFLWLNGSDSPYFDHFMWLYTNKIVWFPLALFFIFLLIYKKNWKEWCLVLFSLFLVFLLCDQFASGVCKPLFARFRPTFHPDFKNQVDIVFGYRGGRYGFISSHAANAFGFAAFTSLLFRDRRYTVAIFIWSTIMAYTRIYLGVHFITDVIPGAVFGILFGYLVYLFYRYSRKKLIGYEGGTALYSKTRIDYILIGMGITLIALI